MLSLSGQLVAVAAGQNKNPETGELTHSTNLSIMTIENGEAQIYKLKADITNLPTWQKCIEKHISIAVRIWQQGGKAGLYLADKKCLPNLQPAQLKAA